jgi:hypothetical protein
MELIDVYHKEHDQRYPTMRRALNLLAERGGKVIIETGCVRMKHDWGAGMSTLLFADWCSRHDAYLYSVDISKANLQTAREVVGDALSPFVTFIESDSIEFLKALGKNSVDLLYLDSLDFPWGEMIDQHGIGMDREQAIRELWEMDEEQVIARYGELIGPCQDHCVGELMAAGHALRDSSIVLMDDWHFPGQGKVRLARLALQKFGWIELSKWGDQQSLWTKE